MHGKGADSPMTGTRINRLSAIFSNKLDGVANFVTDSVQSDVLGTTSQIPFVPTTKHKNVKIQPTWL